MNFREQRFIAGDIVTIGDSGIPMVVTDVLKPYGDEQAFSYVVLWFDPERHPQQARIPDPALRKA